MAISKVKVRCVTRYELLRQLGQGSLTRVYLAALRNEGESPALLVLELMRKELAKNEDLRALFLDQAAVTLQLRHPNIVTTHDVVADLEACGLSMEFLDGQPLRQVLERVGRHRFPLNIHLRILCKVLEALHYVHSFTGPGSPASGLVHRDVSSSNVFVTYDGQVKLLGTGFAQVTVALERELGRRLMDIGYAAPELLLGFSAGPSADLFSVGVMLWEAVAGTRRIEGDPAKVVIHQRTRGEERDLQRVRPDAPRALVEICRRALAVSPRDRYTSAEELKADLEAYLALSGAAGDGLRSLPSLMGSHFGAELSEMRLFMGPALGHAERFVPVPPDMVYQPGPAELTSEGDWNDETHVVVPPVEREPAEERPVEPQLAERRPTPSLPTERRASAPVREPDTGGHRAFSASLVPHPALARPALSRLAWPGAAALAAVVVIGVLTRWQRSRADEVSSSETLALQVDQPAAESSRGDDAPAMGTPLAAPAAELAAAAPALGSTQSEGDGAPAPLHVASLTADSPPLPNAEAANLGAGPAHELRADAGAADAGAAAAPLPSAFLALAPAIAHRSADAEQVQDPDVSFFPHELPLVDDEREDLQEAIVKAARAHRRAIPRRARPRKPAKPPSTPHVPISASPRPIDESDPYPTSE